MAETASVEATGIVAAIATIAAAVVGGFALWFANRLMGRAAFQTAINDGFKKLVQELQAERDAAKQERDQFKAALYAERAAWAAERTHLEGEIQNFIQVIENLRRVLQRQGFEIAEPAKRSD